MFIQNSSVEFPFFIKERWRESAIMSGNCIQVTFTLRALGCLWANLYKSSEARCVLRNTKSNEGPISSSSILGVRQPDFFNRHLCVHITSVSLWCAVLRERTEWLLYKVILNQFLNRIKTVHWFSQQIDSPSFVQCFYFSTCSCA